MDVADLEALKTYTDGLMNHVYYISHDFPVKPERGHHLTVINYADLNERRDDFLFALTNTVSNWVFSKAKQKEIFGEQLAESGEIGSASDFLSNLAKEKFRPGHPQGQFGELLLFNLIQHLFNAVPLLRKQRITTNTSMERNGADAIHYKYEASKNVFVLGESKCYESKYKFAEAFGKSLDSILTTFNSLNKELNLYTYEDFLEPALLKVAKDYKAGRLKDVHFELVCLVIYDENTKLTSNSEADIKAEILECIKKRCTDLKPDFFERCGHLIDRMNYIFFPVWGLAMLLNDFSKKVGSATT